MLSFQEGIHCCFSVNKMFPIKFIPVCNYIAAFTVDKLYLSRKVKGQMLNHLCGNPPHHSPKDDLFQSAMNTRNFVGNLHVGQKKVHCDETDDD